MGGSDIFIFVYIGTIIFGAVSATLIFVITAGDKELILRRVRNFSFALLSYAVFEFLLYYFSGIGASESTKLTLLVFSDLSFFAFVICWVFVMVSAFDGHEIIKKRPLLIFTVIYAVIAEVLSIINIITGPESSLALSEGTASNMILLAVNTIFDLTMLYIGISYTIYGIKMLMRNKTAGKKYFLSTAFSFVFSIYILWIIQWDYKFVTDLLFRDENIADADPIILIYVLFCIGGIAFIYRKRLSKKQYLNEKSLLKDTDIHEISQKYSLSKRETEVIEKILQGHGNAQIAEELFLSEYTVKRHINNIFKKTGVKSRYELMMLKD